MVCRLSSRDSHTPHFYSEGTNRENGESNSITKLKPTAGSHDYQMSSGCMNIMIQFSIERQTLKESLWSFWVRGFMAQLAQENPRFVVFLGTSRGLSPWVV